MAAYLIVPLFTASSTIGLALYQYPMFASFLLAERGSSKTSIAGKPLSQYLNLFLKGGGAIHTLNSLVGTISGGLAARHCWQQQGAAFQVMGSWYAWGATFAFAHMLFFPLLYGPLSRIIASAGRIDAQGEAEVEARNRREVHTWFLRHTLRSLVADGGALYCFIQATALAIPST